MSKPGLLLNLTRLLKSECSLRQLSFHLGELRLDSWGSTSWQAVNSSLNSVDPDYIWALS